MLKVCLTFHWTVRLFQKNVFLDQESYYSGRTEKKESQVLSRTWWFTSIEPLESQTIKYCRWWIKGYLLKNSLKHLAVYKIIKELLKSNAGLVFEIISK